MKNFYKILASFGIAIALIIGALFVAPSPPTVNAQNANNDCFCIQLYDPVCGVDGNTYGNACMAGCAQVTIAHPGECSQVTPTPQPNRYPKSVTTTATVTQTLFGWTKTSMTIQQDLNFQMNSPASVITATETQNIFGTGKLWQHQSVTGTMHWQYPFFTWTSFNW